MEKTLLEETCEKDAGFVQYVVGIPYCKLSLSGRKVQCQHLCTEEDHNGLMKCLNPIYKFPEKGNVN